MLARAAGVPATTIAHWVKNDLVEASLVPGGVQRAPQFWSPRDLLVVRVIKALRDAGCPMEEIRKASQRLRTSTDQDLASSVLCYDGRRIVITDPDDARSMVVSSGQGIFTEALSLTVVPIKPWLEHAHASAQVMDISAYAARHAARERAKKQRRTTTTAVIREVS
jgi:DNA-binding transcriptional MerR regulator